MLCKKIPSSLLDASPLGWSQSLLEILGLVTRSGLDLDKNNRVFLCAYEVDLSGDAAVVVGENTVAMTPQIASDNALTSRAENMSAITPWTQPAQAPEFLF